jgi:dTDP-4-amino-4,6-dideoxygalactose transaminase
MDAILGVAAKHHLAVVEDCAQSHLATCAGRPTGTIGVAGAFSFYPTKNLGALGDGGAVVTRDAQLAARVRRLRNGGQTARYHHEEFGVNSRLDEIQAAILRERLSFLPAWTSKRRGLGREYRKALEGAPVQVPPERDAGHVYHLFPVLSGDRTRLQQHLASQGIETLIHYPVPIPRQPALAATGPAACPNADLVCQRLLSLPLYPALSIDQVRAVADAVRSFVPGKTA